MYDDLVARARKIAADDHMRGCEGRCYTCNCAYDYVKDNALTDLCAAIERLQAELAEAKASEERAWRERNVAYAKVKAWEAVVYVEGLPLRAVRVDEWGPGEGEQTTVPDVTPKRLTELLDELAAIRERT